MAFFKFDDNDVFINTLKTYPEFEFFIYSGSVYIDNTPNISGSHAGYIAGTGIHPKHDGAAINGVPYGYISLYEQNVNRPSGSIIYEIDENRANDDHVLGVHDNFGIDSTRQSETDATGSLIRPFVVSDGFKNSLKSLTNPQHNVLFDKGEIIEAEPDLSASIVTYYIADQSSVSAGSVDSSLLSGFKAFKISGITPDNTATGETYVHFSLENTINKYNYLSPHLTSSTAANTSLPLRDLTTDEVSLIEIPSIFYGKKIKPGSIQLDYYISGSLIGTLKDTGKRGELVQTFGTSSSPVDYTGTCQGIVLYNEGLIILTGSTQIGVNNSISYLKNDGSSTGNTLNKWTHFGNGLGLTTDAQQATLASASFNISYQGESEIQTMMMMAHARYENLNWSNNPTFVDQANTYLGVFSSGSNHYKEEEVFVANVTDTELIEYTPKQKKETYISKVAIYDERKNLIGVATMANPVRKTEDRQYTFKLKFDF
tara:strand:+ start:552 stop:2006 length:1455 start_codon:yes stop_codon:yes gene_type:complete